MNNFDTRDNPAAGTPEPTLGGNYTVIFDHYVEIPMQYGRLITDAASC